MAPRPADAEGAAVLRAIRRWYPDAPENGIPAWVQAGFRPRLLSATVLFTGYYEPVLGARAAPEPPFLTPLHGPPPDPLLGLSRAEVAAGGLAGLGLALGYVADPIAAFLAEVQGSVRLSFPGGLQLRLNFAARNRHPYVSLGAALQLRGLLPPGPTRLADLRQALEAAGAGLQDLLNLNPSKVYFRVVTGLDPAEGPLGSAGHPLTAGLSLAADPEFVPPGSLIRITSPATGTALRLAEDTGGAIRGKERADLFFGSGDAAGQAAGALNARGSLWLMERRQ